MLPELTITADFRALVWVHNHRRRRLPSSSDGGPDRRLTEVLAGCRFPFPEPRLDLLSRLCTEIDKDLDASISRTCILNSCQIDQEVLIDRVAAVWWEIFG
ncbi:hypothetical protein ZIOFF_047442 [Zingiber officinale]|uniref:Uncharacterized protein n=1 Tax=Zingiber officinale TaxID=94328 RepID=A0A8J5FQV1_ZINOF|nr:hypothetical protein ZIOFF_047442 [Zingiber officinale]